MRPTRMRGFNEANGSWNTICRRERSGRKRETGIARYILAQEGNAAPGRLDQSQERPPDCRFTRAAFTDEGESLSRRDDERNTVDRLHNSFGVLPKMHDEVLNLEERRYGHGLTVPDMISAARMQRAARLGPMVLSKGTGA